MEKELPLNDPTHVVVEVCSGQLTIRTRPERRLMARGQQFTADISDETGHCILKSDGDLNLWLPKDATVTIQKAHGAVLVKGIIGGVYIGQAYGQVHLKNVGETALARVNGRVTGSNLNGRLQVEKAMGDVQLKNVMSVHGKIIKGDFSAHYVSGTVTLDQCWGDAFLRTVSDAVTVQMAKRDVNLQNVGGLITVSEATGDIRVKERLPMGKHVLKANSDIIVRWPVGAPVLIDAHAPEIINRLPLENVTEGDGLLNGQIGGGGARLNLKAGSSIVLKPLHTASWPEEGSEESDFAIDLDFNVEMEQIGRHMAGLGEQIAAEVSNKMAKLTTQLDSQFKALRKKEEAVRRAKQRTENYTARTPRPPAPPPPPKRPKAAAPAQENGTSDAAQMKILEMLEAGKINIDEAQMLLQALG